LAIYWSFRQHKSKQQIHEETTVTLINAHPTRANADVHAVNVEVVSGVEVAVVGLISMKAFQLPVGLPMKNVAKPEF
jgi:hypothetical protein